MSYFLQNHSHAFYVKSHAFYVSHHGLCVSLNIFCVRSHAFCVSQHESCVSHHRFRVSQHAFCVSQHTFYVRATLICVRNCIKIGVVKIMVELREGICVIARNLHIFLHLLKPLLPAVVNGKTEYPFQLLSTFHFLSIIHIHDNLKNSQKCNSPILRKLFYCLL